ncbi:Protein of unknown function DUF707 - like 2 [Theobroma cacao]|nr:Protein of unknown function DUF707 - like 2 [Theobroma cacao]
MSNSVTPVEDQGLEISQPALDLVKSKGDFMKNVGVVDVEYIVHLGLSTLGVMTEYKAPSESHKVDNRLEVRAT